MSAIIPHNPKRQTALGRPMKPQQASSLQSTLEAGIQSASASNASVKNARARVGHFCTWLADVNGQKLEALTIADLLTVNLNQYRDYLLAGSGDRKPVGKSTVVAYLSTIRRILRDMATDNAWRDSIYQSTPLEAGETYADHKARVDEIIQRVTNAGSVAAGKVKLTTVQDETAERHIRLTEAQAQRLIELVTFHNARAPLQAARNAAIVALLLCTGIREFELTALQVADLKATNEAGDLCLLVRKGKGSKQRLVPYGELAWCLEFVYRWLDMAGITEGAVFRGLYNPAANGRQKVRQAAMSENAVQGVLSGDPARRLPPCGFTSAGEPINPAPHDLRRTYAKLQYGAGMEPIAIQQNLGHDDLKTTLKYIGKLDSAARRGKLAIRPPHINW